MKTSNDYLDDLLVRTAHHSTAIEGNTLTQGEVKSILIDGYIPSMTQFNCPHASRTLVPCSSDFV